MLGYTSICSPSFRPIAPNKGLPAPIKLLIFKITFFNLVALPKPILNILPVIFFAFMVLLIAATTSSTWIKSLF